MCLMNTIALSKFLGIGRDRSYALMRAPGFPSICLNGQYLVSEEAVLAWLKKYEGKKFTF